MNDWNYDALPAPAPFGSDSSYQSAAEFLDSLDLVEDWGSGSGYSRRFFSRARLVLVDSCRSKWADVVEDIASRQSYPDGILLRHVLEYQYNWEAILKNAVASFTRRMVIVISTPFGVETTQQTYDKTHNVPVLSFAYCDVVRHFLGIWRAELVYQTERGQERAFFLNREAVPIGRNYRFEPAFRMAWVQAREVIQPPVIAQTDAQTDSQKLESICTVVESRQLPNLRVLLASNDAFANKPVYVVCSASDKEAIELNPALYPNVTAFGFLTQELLESADTRRLSELKGCRGELLLAKRMVITEALRRHTTTLYTCPETVFVRNFDTPVIGELGMSPFYRANAPLGEDHPEGFFNSNFILVRRSAWGHFSRFWSDETAKDKRYQDQKCLEQAARLFNADWLEFGHGVGPWRFREKDSPDTVIEVGKNSVRLNSFLISSFCVDVFGVSKLAKTVVKILRQLESCQRVSRVVNG